MAKKKKTIKKVDEPKKNGRPTKYKPEFCDQLMTFFNSEPYYDINVEHFGKDGELKWIDHKRVPNNLPTMVEFAKMIGVSYATVYDWLDKKNGAFQPKFLQSYMRARHAQKNFIIQNGLQGLYNPVFGKFVAINMTDMVDKIEVKDPDKDKPSEQFQQNLAKMTREEVSKAIMDQIYTNKTKKKINIPKK